MNTPANKKEILSDPLAAFISAHGEASDDIKNKLEHSSQRHRELKKSIKDNKKTRQHYSRLIGEAKKNKNNIESLMASMQKISQEIKSSEKRLREIENDILDLFQRENDRTDQNPDAGSDIPRYRIKDVSPEDIYVKSLTDEHAAWNDYVDHHPAGCIHHRCEWSQLLHQSYGHQSFYLYACNDENKILGVLPMVRLKSRLFGDMLVSMPFFQRAGAIADHPAIENKLIDSANRIARRKNLEHIEYRDDIRRDDMPVQMHKVNMVLTLAASIDEQWSSFSAKLRAQIKRPQRENTSVSIGHIELLDAFYSVYTRNMRDLGSPPHSKKFIANILARFPENSWLIVIHLDGNPVAAGFLLGHNKTLEIPLASTVRNVNPLSINMLLYWEVLQFAIKNSFEKFDFGRSSIDAGTYRFKKQWGAQPKQLYWHYYLHTASQMPGINTSNPKFKLVISIWKHLPVVLTKLIGPRLVKNIP